MRPPRHGLGSLVYGASQARSIRKLGASGGIRSGSLVAGKCVGTGLASHAFGPSPMEYFHITVIFPDSQVASFQYSNDICCYGSP